jgi:hypothetical protein
MSPLSGQRQQSGTEVRFLEVLPFFEGLWEKNTVETNSSHHVNPNTPSLLSLPGEIRNVIFSHIEADIQKQPKARRTLRQLHPAATNGGNNANMTGYHGLKQTCRQL